MRQPRFLNQSLFAELADKAAANPRGRQHHNFHEMDEPCHRMAVGLQPDTYIQPHRHVSAGKAECVIVLKGSLGLLIFSEQGEVIDKRVLQAGGECVGVDMAEGTYHGLVVLEPDSIMFECKAGPYVPVGAGEAAPWAPREGEAGVADYHAWMRAQFV